MSKRKKITFSFDNEHARDHFVSWLSGSGEQHYWDWMDMRESEWEGNITALRFNYGWPDPDYSKPIVAECGRMDAEQAIHLTGKLELEPMSCPQCGKVRMFLGDAEMCLECADDRMINGDQWNL